jgi:hypothetical protein
MLRSETFKEISCKPEIGSLREPIASDIPDSTDAVEEMLENSAPMDG